MKYWISLLVFVSIFAHSSCVAQNTGRIIITAPSIEQEATSIWRTINYVDFLISQGYNYALPDHPSIQALVEKSQMGQFGNEDYPTIYSLLESGLYQESQYATALENVYAEEELIKELIQQVIRKKESWYWDFKVYEEYNIVFTLYGSGGSYDPDNGTITLFTNPEGQFKRYKSPVNTIIHEFIHLGIEESIIQQYQLSHVYKENLVDQMVYLLFKKELPDYKIQPMGDGRVGKLVQRRKDVVRLAEKVSGLGGG